VVSALAPYRDRLDVVNVDAAGIGYYLAKHLQDVGYPVRPVNVGERAGDRERYVNLKAEFYWGLRLRFQQGDIAGLTDERTVAQLAGIRYQHTARGQVEIERKEDARKRGVKSPDRAEAVMLAFARPAMTQLLMHDGPIETTGRSLHGYDEQVRDWLPFDLDHGCRPTCGTCCYFVARGDGPGDCTLRDLVVRDQEIGCEFYDPPLGEVPR
jgi:hypothetical protein